MSCQNEDLGCSVILFSEENSSHFFIYSLINLQQLSREYLYYLVSHNETTVKALLSISVSEITIFEEHMGIASIISKTKTKNMP